MQEKAHQINPEKARWLEDLGIAMPLCLSYLPIGIACGILLHAAGMNFMLTLLVSIVVFSGGAQFILASLLVIDAPVTTIFITLFFLELRYALLGSSLSKYLNNESPAMIFLFSFSMNDENYAVNYLKFVTDKHWTTRDALMVEHYSLISWAGGNMIGGLIGNTITIDLNIVDFALTALFLYMIVMQIQRRLSLVICVLTVFVSLFCLLITRHTIGIIISTLLMSLLGFWIEFQVKKHHPKPDETWILGKLFRPRTTRTTKEDVEVEKQLVEEAEAAEDDNQQANDEDEDKHERGDES